MDLYIDPVSGVPIYRQIAGQIRQQIRDGRLPPGTRLPPVRELAATLTVNPNTVARAYRELESSGLLDTLQGSGTFVRESVTADLPEPELSALLPYLDRLLEAARLQSIPPERVIQLLKDRLAGRQEE